MDPCLLKNLFLARRLRIQNPTRCVKIGPVQHPNTQATLKWYKIQYQNAMKCCWIVKTLAFETFRNFWNSKINSIFVKKEGKKPKKTCFLTHPLHWFLPCNLNPQKWQKKQSTPVLSVVAQTIEAQAFLAHLEDAKSNCLHRVAHEQDGGYNPFINGIRWHYCRNIPVHPFFFVSMSFLLQNSRSESSLRFTWVHLGGVEQSPHLGLPPAIPCQEWL